MPGTIWNPQVYAAFAGERGRPFADLLAQVGAADPRLVLDLGCGDGPLTLGMATRWPQARIVGVDSSVEMLQSARSLDTAARIEWIEADLTHLDLSTLGEPDVIVSNAALQWIPRQLELLPRWMAALAPGGWLGIQVPGNFDAPSHALMREVAAEHPRHRELLAALRRPASPEPSTYLHLLARAGLQSNVWETTYLHVLPGGGPEHPVLQWVRATGLRPVLEVLVDPVERERFLGPYAERLEDAYPVSPGGVILPFRRIFAVGRKLP